MTDCRLLIDPPAPGAWNMAVDEVLLDWAARSGGCCWRFYRWSEPTLSLGYFQNYADRAAHAASGQCAVVRRASGGGAILHDAELTYSFVVPLGHPLALNRLALYRAVHATLIELLEHLGAPAVLCGGHKPEPSQSLPFLCFQRRSDGDVVMNNVKIAGSAQRRNQGAVLQHGSILLDRSHAAPELQGLNDLVAAGLDSDRLVQLWLPRLASRLGLQWYVQPLGESEHRQAEYLVQTKYGAEIWTCQRGRSKPG